jgi:hypothetical protein
MSAGMWIFVAWHNTIELRNLNNVGGSDDEGGTKSVNEKVKQGVKSALDRK